MKKNLVVIAALALLVSINGFAQTHLAGADVKVTIPFSFYAGDQALPAGTYNVRSDVEHRVLVLRSDKTGGLFVATNGLEAQSAPGNGQLVFKRYGSNYFLQQMWISGSTAGQEVRRGKFENELASKGAPVEMVMVRPHSH